MHHSNRKRRRLEEDDWRRRSRHDHRRRSYSTSDTSSQSPSPSQIRRSPSPYRRRRSPSPTRNRSLSPYRRRSPSPYKSKRRSPSPSPYRKRRSSIPTRERSPPPYARRQSPSQNNHRHSSSYHRSRSPRMERNGDSRLKHSKSWHNIHRQNTPPRRNIRVTDQKASDREARLSAMQEAACELDQDRANRLAALEERERFEQEIDDAARAKSSKNGGKGNFVVGLHRTAGELEIGERMRRGRQGFQKDMGD